MSAKDQFGKKVEVGDDIIYVDSGRSASFMQGTVVKVHPKGGVNVESRRPYKTTFFNITRFIKYTEPA